MISASRQLLLVSRALYRQLHSYMPIVLSVTPGRVLQGLLYGWFSKYHSHTVRSLVITHRIPPEFDLCSRGLISCLKECSQLHTLSLNIGDTAMSLTDLGSVVLSMKMLHRFSLICGLRNDVDVTTLRDIFAKGLQCQHWRLGLKMCNVDDDTLSLLLELAQQIPPQWVSVHLGLKHNHITNVGAHTLMRVLQNAPQLKRLHVDLSYNHTAPTQKLWVPNLVGVQNCTIKMDGDVFRLSPFHMESFWAKDLYALRLSTAFCCPIIAPKLHMGGGRLHSLDIDFEGCHFSDDSLLHLATCLRENLSPSLRRLSLVLLGCNIRQESLLHILVGGINHLGGLESLTLAFNASDIWSVDVDVALSQLPPFLSSLRSDLFSQPLFSEQGCCYLQMGYIPDFECTGLSTATHLHSLLLHVTACTIRQLVLPRQLKTFVLDAADGTWDTLIELPPAIRDVTLYLERAQVTHGFSLHGCAQLCRMKVQAQGIPPVQAMGLLRTLEQAPPEVNLKQLELSIPSESVNVLWSLVSVLMRFAATLFQVKVLLKVFQPNVDTRLLCSALERLPVLTDLGLTLLTKVSTKCVPVCSEHTFDSLQSLHRLSLDVQHLCLGWYGTYHLIHTIPIAND